MNGEISMHRNWQCLCSLSQRLINSYMRSTLRHWWINQVNFETIFHFKSHCCIMFGFELAWSIWSLAYEDITIGVIKSCRGKASYTRHLQGVPNFTFHIGIHNIRIKITILVLKGCKIKRPCIRHFEGVPQIKSLAQCCEEITISNTNVLFHSINRQGFHQWLFLHLGLKSALRIISKDTII